MTPEPETKPCNAGGARIPLAAEVCSSCKGHQRRWKARVQFFSSITALLVASDSLAARTLGQLPSLRTQLFPRTKLVVISCNTLEGGVVANVGDETLFLSHIIHFNTGSKEWVAQRFPINQSLSSNGFLRVPSPWAEGLDGTFVRGASAQRISELITKAAGANAASFRLVLFAENDPMYREELARAGGPTLNRLPATGYLEYFSMDSLEQPLHLSIAAVGVLMAGSKAGCLQEPHLP